MPTIDLISTDTSLTDGESIDATTHEGYRLVLRLMFPNGWTWDIQEGTKLELWVRAIAWELSRVDRRTKEVALEFSPNTAQETLPAWEEVLGLPGDCPNPPTTLSGRQDAAFAKLTESISDNPEYFLRLARALGYSNATIRLLGNPFTSISNCNDSLYGWEGNWINTWEMVTGGSTDNDGTLICRVREAAQLHTFVQFDFS